MKKPIALAFAVLFPWVGVASAEEAGDPKAGQTVFVQCKTCHSLDAGKNGVGPSLRGIIGRKSGTAPGFHYSDAMAAAGIVWSEDNISKYLADPKGFVPGNKMSYAGVKDEVKRRDVIAYLKESAQ